MAIPLQDLIAQRADLDALIAAARAADFHTAVQHAAHLFGEAGVPLDEAATALLTLHNQSTRPQRAKGAPKYRHRVTGATWTGRGKQPKWFAAAEQSEIEHLGRDLAEREKSTTYWFACATIQPCGLELCAPRRDEMKTFYVLLLRSIELLGSQGIDTVQHLQYIAGPIQATDENAAAELAQAELVAADRKDKDKDKVPNKETVVLGAIEDGIYRPWLNGHFR